MKKIITILTLVLTLSSYGQEFNYNRDYNVILAQTLDEKSELSYDKLILKFKANDTTLTSSEVLALLIGFTVNPNYKAYSDLKLEREVYALNDNGEFREAIQKGLKFNSTHPLNQMTLIELSYAYHKIAMPDSAHYYRVQFKNVMAAMLYSGKGTTADSAFFSLTPIDGQNFIRKYMASKIGTMGSGSDSHDNFVDILGVIPKDGVGEEVLFYFHIEHAMKELKLQLNDAKNSKENKNIKEKRKKKGK